MISVCHIQPVHVPEESRKSSYSKPLLVSCKSFIYSRNVTNDSSDCMQLIHSLHMSWATYDTSYSVRVVSSTPTYNCEELNILAKSC